MSEAQQAHVHELFAAYCAKRAPAAVRAEIRVGYRVDANAVILYEERPAFQTPHDWQEMVVAKFRYVGTDRKWRLYCQHRDLKWHAYEALPAASRLVTLLDEVDADPTGIFWG